MDGILEKIQKIDDTKTQLKSVIVTEGVTMPDNVPFGDYPSKVVDAIGTAKEAALTSVNVVLDKIIGEMLAYNTVEKADNINDSKESIRQAIIAKNVAVPDTTLFRQYASMIAAISQESGEDGMTEQQVIEAINQAINTAVTNLATKDSLSQTDTNVQSNRIRIVDLEDSRLTKVEVDSLINTAVNPLATNAALTTTNNNVNALTTRVTTLEESDVVVSDATTTIKGISRFLDLHDVNSRDYIDFNDLLGFWNNGFPELTEEQESNIVNKFKSLSVDGFIYFDLHSAFSNVHSNIIPTLMGRVSELENTIGTVTTRLGDI